MGNDEIAITPNHHMVRTDDGGTTGGTRGTMNDGSLMDTMETPTTVQRRQPGVARRAKHSHVTPHCKVSPQTIWPLSHHKSIGTSDIPTPPSRTVEYTPSVSRGPPNAI